MSDDLRPEPGLVVGRWTLVERIGKGGNAEVWKAVREGGEGALKLLRGQHTARSTPYERFRLEIMLLRDLNGRPGIMPHLDSELPERSCAESPAFLAMPIALPLSEYFAGAFIPTEEVIAAVARYASVLAELHQERVWHRDIKPDNLFLLNKDWVIGDFGIASFPGKPELTPTGKKLGPYHFMAPEMWEDARSADGGPADVYSLAKTLWVLLTGRRYPFLGQLRIDNPDHRISSHLHHERLSSLERIVERCTADRPEDRPSMEEFARELNAWLSPAVVEAPEVDVNTILREVSDMREATVRERARVGSDKRDLEGLREKITNELRGIQSTFQDMQLRVGSMGDANADSLAQRGRDTFGYDPEAAVMQTSTVAAGGNGCGVRSGVTMILWRDGKVSMLAAHLFVPPGKGAGLEVLEERSFEFSLGGALEDSQVNEAINHLLTTAPVLYARIRDFYRENPEHR